MSITVRELMRLPHLQMSLIAGGSGADRKVSWVHTSDLPNSWEWHGAGELLLTNGTGLDTKEPAQVQFVERMAESGASGLAFGLGTGGPPLTDGASRRADELALPLLTVPFSVPFTAIVRAVADANDREESRQLWRVARLYELLRTSVAAGRPGPETFRRLGEELGVRLYLVDPATGLSLFDDHQETVYAAALAASYAAHGNAIPGMLRLRLPDAAPGEICAVAVAVPGDHPTALVVEPIGDQLPSPVVLQHVAVGGALELAQLTAGQERQRRLGADLLARLLDRRIDPRVAEAQLAEYGLDPASCVLAAARGGTDGTGAELDRRLARARIPHLLLYRDHTLYVVIADTAADAGLLVTPGGQAGALGASDRLRAADRLPEAAQEACWALSAAEAEGRRIVRYGDETAVLLPRTPTEARVLVSRILSPLMSHDAEHGTDYVQTLRVVLRLDRSWQRAAAELHIHRQTLGYRIRRIEQITGRGLTRTDHIAEWWIALRAHDLLTGRNPSLRPAGRGGTFRLAQLAATAGYADQSHMTSQSETGHAGVSSRCGHLCCGMMSRCQHPRAKGGGRGRGPGGAGCRRACAAGVPPRRRWPWSPPLSRGSRSSRTAAAAARTGQRRRRPGLRPRRPSWTPPSRACCRGGWRHRSAVRWWWRDRRAS